MLAIYAKELRVYFTGLLAYLVGTVFLVLCAYFFYTNLYFFLLWGGMNLPRGLWQYQMHDMRLVLLLIVPLLTMRLFAEEKKLGTLELLWTYPVHDLAIVVGKFLACMTAVAAMLAATALYPLLLARYTTVASGPLLAGYLGLFLLAAAFSACGLWISSLTDSQLVAGSATLGVLLLFWVLTWNQAAASELVVRLLTPLSLFDRFYTFARGGIDLKDVVYLCLFTLAFLALTLFSLESRRWRGVR